MACKVIVVTLLGLLACAALASAQEAAGKKDDKNREQEKENFKQDRDGYKSRQQLRDRKERDYKELDTKESNPRQQPDNRDKPELVRAPKMLHNTEMTLEIFGTPTFQAEGINVGNSAVLDLLLQSNGKVVGYAVLTGIANEVDLQTGTFTLNSIMTIGFSGVGEKLDGAILTAQGLVSWDGTKKEIVKGKDTLIVTGGSGVAAGADGTVTLAGGESTAVPRTLTLKISVPKAHNHKDESKEN